MVEKRMKCANFMLKQAYFPELMDLLYFNAGRRKFFPSLPSVLQLLNNLLKVQKEKKPKDISIIIQTVLIHMGRQDACLDQVDALSDTEHLPKKQSNRFFPIPKHFP